MCFLCIFNTHVPKCGATIPAVAGVGAGFIVVASPAARAASNERGTSEEEARNERTRPSAVSRCRQPLPSAVAVSQAGRWMLGGRWQARRLTAALFRLGGRRQARRLGASVRRLVLRKAGAAAGCYALAAWGSLRLKLRFCPSSSSSSSAPALWGALAPFAMGAAAAAAAAVPPLRF